MIDYENLGKANSTFFDEYRASFEKTLQSGWYILGNNVKQFEEEFAAFNNAEYCVGLTSGLDALILGLRALDLPPGSEVIVPSNTYIATIIAIVQAGLRPVLVEPDITTYNIDPGLIEQHINDNTSALMLVHLYGKPCDMEPIMKLKEKYGLKMVEDCAQSHDARYDGKFTGTFGEIGAFSFYPTKNLGALGDAGAVITNDAALADNIRMLRNYGSKIKYQNDSVGFNSRLHEFQAGFLSVKLRHLKRITEHKQSLAAIYHSELKDAFIKPVEDERSNHVYHIYNIRHPERDRLRKFLLDNGVKTDIHYPIAPHKQKAMKGILPESGYPISEEIHSTTLSLPISFAHSEDDIRRVCEVMNLFE